MLCGNATDPKGPAQLLGALRPSLMVTDPPYGVEYDPAWRARAGVNLNKKKLGRVINDDRADWREAWQHFPAMSPDVWHASLFTSVVLASLEAAGFEHRAMIIWAKDRFTLSRGHYQWQHEPAWYAVRKGKTGHWCGTLAIDRLEYQGARGQWARAWTQKPVECMRRPIVNHTNPGQCVYDPFVGSGTTIIAAETIGRVCLAIDIEPAYVDVAVERWQNFTGMQAILEADGRSFDEIKSERRGPEISGTRGGRP